MSKDTVPIEFETYVEAAQAVASGRVVSLARIREHRKDHLQHNIPLGQVVEVEVSHNDDVIRNDKDEEICVGIFGLVRMYVVGHGRDCDGTPLYSLASKPVGKSADCNVFCDEAFKYNHYVEHCFRGFTESRLKVVEGAQAKRFYVDIFEFYQEEMTT